MSQQCALGTKKTKGIWAVLGLLLADQGDSSPLLNTGEATPGP